MSNRASARRAAPISRADRKAATRARLLRVAERAFTRDGFDGTSVADICREARVTHGALYHHFASVTELFAAVLEQLNVALAARVRRATEDRTGWEQVEAACGAYLDACTEPHVQNILLRDGPRVLSPERFAAIDHGTHEPLVIELLRRWVGAGLLRPIDVVLTARVLGGAFAEAGAALAAADDPAAVRAELGELFRSWLGSLRPAFNP